MSVQASNDNIENDQLTPLNNNEGATISPSLVPWITMRNKSGQSQPSQVVNGRNMEIDPTGKQPSHINKSNPTAGNDSDESSDSSMIKTLTGNSKEEQKVEPPSTQSVNSRSGSHKHR